MINVGTSIGRKSAKQRKTPVQEKKIAAINHDNTPGSCGPTMPAFESATSSHRDSLVEHYSSNAR